MTLFGSTSSGSEVLARITPIKLRIIGLASLALLVHVRAVAAGEHVHGQAASAAAI